jgi:CBS-domain-containing membrane protein
MFDERLHRLVVVDDEGRVKGIVTTMDLLGAFVRSAGPPAEDERPR